MKVFITGGTGFIGKHLVNKLIQERLDVTILVRNSRRMRNNNKENKINFIAGDLSNFDTWKKDLINLKPDVCIHLAWEAIPNYSYKYSKKNLIMSLNLFDVLAKSGCKKIISSGSCWEYNRKKGKLSEDLTICPEKPFIAAKHSTHVMGRELSKEKNMDFIWTRFFYVYGPGQNRHSLIPHIINSIESGKQPEIKTPFSKNDFVYVEDVAKALLMILRKGSGITSYNIGSGHTTQIKDIIDMVYINRNSKERFIINNKKLSDSENIDFYADIEKISKEIGWHPEIGIEDGIKKTIDYF